MDVVPAGGTEAENRQRCSADQPAWPETGPDSRGQGKYPHCMDESPDITIEEIREKLNLSASYSIVDRVIAAMGYTLKKKSLYASERDRVRCAGKAQRMERSHKT